MRIIWPEAIWHTDCYVRPEQLNVSNLKTTVLTVLSEE
jgi:hypothetical protein